MCLTPFEKHFQKSIDKLVDIYNKINTIVEKYEPRIENIV